MTKLSISGKEALPSTPKIFYLCFLALTLSVPFGPALQSLMTAVVAITILRSRRTEPLWGIGNITARLSVFERRAWVCMAVLLVLLGMATWLNPKNPSHEIPHYILGHLAIFCLPCLFVLARPFSPEQWRKIRLIFAIVAIIWAVTAMSQMLLGWKLAGASIVTGDRYKRAQAFFSHPLTLAYVSLMLWPLAVNLFLRDIRKVTAHIYLFSLGVLLYGSASRTAQVVAFIVLFWAVLSRLRGKVRWLSILAILLGTLLVLNTDNMISQRFMSMGQKISEEKESSYPDDRLLFWHVHWLLVQERPILGHGIHLDRPYRISYYERLGYIGFKKAYEAHNQLLQLTAEGGVFSLVTFILWLWFLHKSWPLLSKNDQQIRDQTIVALLLGGLTQNAFQDTEVRFAITNLSVLAFLISRGPKD